MARRKLTKIEAEFIARDVLLIFCRMGHDFTDMLGTLIRYGAFRDFAMGRYINDWRFWQHVHAMVDLALKRERNQKRQQSRPPDDDPFLLKQHLKTKIKEANHPGNFVIH